VVVAICNKYVAIGGHHHTLRLIEARVRPWPVCKACLNAIIFVIIFLPAASQCADDGALLCH
jgi:hypothetical protein